MTFIDREYQLPAGENLFHQRDVYNTIFALLLLVLLIWVTTIIPWYLQPLDLVLAVIAWVAASLMGIVLSYLFRLFVDIYLPTLLAIGIAIALSVFFAVLPLLIIIAGKNPGFFYFSPVPVMIFSALYFTLFLFTGKEQGHPGQRSRILLYHTIPVTGLLLAGLSVMEGPIHPLVYFTGLTIVVVLLGVVHRTARKVERQAAGQLEELLLDRGVAKMSDLPAKESDIKEQISKGQLESVFLGDRIIHLAASRGTKREVLKEVFEHVLDPRDEVSAGNLTASLDELFNQVFLLLESDEIFLLLNQCSLLPRIHGDLADILSKREGVEKSWLVELREKASKPEIVIPGVNRKGYPVADSELSMNEQRLVEIMDKMEREARRWNAQEENNRLSRELARMSEGLEIQKWLSNSTCKNCKRSVQVIGVHEFNVPDFKLEFTFCRQCQKGSVCWITVGNIVKYDHQIETVASFFDGLRVLRHPAHHLLFVDPSYRIFGIHDINRDETFPFPQNMERTRTLANRDMLLLEKHWSEIQRIIDQEKKSLYENSPVKPRLFQNIGQHYLTLAKQYLGMSKPYEAYEFAYRSNYFLAKALLTKVGGLNGKPEGNGWIDSYASLLSANGMTDSNGSEDILEDGSSLENLDTIHDVLMGYDQFIMMKQLPSNEATRFMVSIAELASAVIESPAFERESF